MSPARILIVEDEPKVALFIKEGLEENQFGAEIAYDGLTGKQMALNGNFDAVILDVNLPVMNGLEVCREIRKMNLTVPVLMLTALGTTEDKLNGFDNGSDDYLVKPFEFRELLARIKVMLKRSQQNTAHGHVLRIADLELNTETKTVKRNNIQIELTAKEFA
ncbi:MAG: response regulator transcription factor, partial [Bacteroidia bacterium]